jgi:hypothetical protein
MYLLEAMHGRPRSFHTGAWLKSVYSGSLEMIYIPRQTCPFLFAGPASPISLGSGRFASCIRGTQAMFILKYFRK